MFRIKNYLIFLIIVLFIPIVYGAQGDILISYEVKNDVTQVGANNANLEEKAQSFNSSSNITVQGIQLNISAKLNTPDEAYWVEIQTDSAGLPSNNLACEDCSSNNITGTSVVIGWNQWNFSESINLNDTTPYWIVVRSNETTGEGQNMIRPTIDINDAYLNGSMATRTNGGAWSGLADDMTFRVIEGGFLPGTPIINSSWQVTSDNIIGVESNSTWNEGGQINISTNLLSFTVDTNINSNMSCRIDVEGNYTENINFNANTKSATTETTSHALTVYENISYGNHCLYCAFADEQGNERNAGNSTSGCLNFTRMNDLTNVTVKLHPKLQELSYNINFSLVNVNFTQAIINDGNWTWNFSQNVTNFVIDNTTNVTNLKYTFNVSNNGTDNVTIGLRQNQTKPWYEWYCKGVNITNTLNNLINLSNKSSTIFNCTLNLINISQSYVNYTLTSDRSNYDFNYLFE